MWQFVTGFAKTLHVHVFYTSSQNSHKVNQFKISCTKRKLENFSNGNESSTMSH